MGALAQAVLPFKIEATKEVLTANTGLALLGEFVRRLGRSNQRIAATWIRQTGITVPTLDGDASPIVAEKDAPHLTYKGEQDYMPMIGHLAETGIVIHDEFRAGNIAPATDNLGFIQACEARLHKGLRIALCGWTRLATRPASSTAARTPARPSPLAHAWMPRRRRSLPRFPKRPECTTPTTPWRKHCTA